MLKTLYQYKYGLKNVYIIIKQIIINEKED